MVARGRVAAVAQPLRFQGQYADAETGLHYNRHRYYSPAEGCFVTQDPIRPAGGANVAAYAPNPVTWVDPLGLACTFDAADNTWRDRQTGQPRARPDDPSELVHNGRIDHGDIHAWASEGGLPNNWQTDPTRFPNGGYKYNQTSGSHDYQVHGHGIDPNAATNFPGSNSASGPTTTITRTPVGASSKQALKYRTDGTWAKFKADPDAAHIPTDNSPF